MSGAPLFDGGRMLEERMHFFSVSYYIFSCVFLLTALISLKYGDFMPIDRYWPFNKTTKYNWILYISLALVCYWFGQDPLGGRNTWTVFVGYLYCVAFIFSLVHLIRDKK